MNSRSICIVDDDKIYQFASTKLLQRYSQDIHVTCHDHGKAAIDFLQSLVDNNEKFPDVILLDINMPVLDGWGFLEQYKQLKIDTKKEVDIYIVSSSIDNRDMVKSKEYPEVKGYLIKPLKEDNYKAIVGL
jgi:two-component system chemotaxis response regulator CheY